MGGDHTAPRITNESVIAQARLKKGMTQAELAEILGVKPPQLSRWEIKGRKPKIEVLIKIASVLDVELIDLINDYQ